MAKIHTRELRDEKCLLQNANQLCLGAIPAGNAVFYLYNYSASAVSQINIFMSHVTLLILP